MHEGIARGGPLNGVELASRKPVGVLVVDKFAERCWIYDWSDERAEFEVREPEGRLLDHSRRWDTAERYEFDIIAIGGGM